MTREEIAAGLDAGSHFAIEMVDECASTNALLLERAEAGAPSGIVIVARQQTAGRGRLGRQWISAPGDSLTFSLLWRFDPDTVPLGLSLAVGMAVARAVAKVGGGGTASTVSPQLKWPNDVLLDGRKLAGVLIELVPGAAHAAVIGIGLNLRLPEAMPEALKSTSAALPGEVNAARLLGELLNQLSQVCSRFADTGFAGLRDEWMRWHAHQDCEVGMLSEGAMPVVGICRGVASSGALLLEVDGVSRQILAGDVSLRAT